MSMKLETNVDIVVNALRDRIISHDLPPGVKLREQALAEQFKISRPRLREAFLILEDRGLIERVKNQGARVIRLNAKMTHDLFELRSVLEGLAVRLATENVPPDSWDDLAELFGTQAEEAIDAQNLDLYISYVDKFRARTVAAADNTDLTNTLDMFLDRTKMLIRRLALVPGRAREGMLRHRDILKAMRAGDAVLAEQLKRANIKEAQACFRQYESFLL